MSLCALLRYGEASGFLQYSSSMTITELLLFEEVVVWYVMI